MNRHLKQNNPITYEQDSKIMQLSDFTELSDQELELLVGGCDSSTSTSVQECIFNLPGMKCNWICPLPEPPSPVPPGATS